MMIKIIIYPPFNQVELLNLIHLLFFNPRVDGLGNYFSKSVFENCFLKIYSSDHSYKQNYISELKYLK